MADIQQMFHSFLVKEEHRNFLRFLWFKDHDLDGEVLEYRMRVHVFGNCPSPAVAIYGLKRTAAEAEQEYGADARNFIDRHFYVDDGLKSFSTANQAADVLARAQEALAQSNFYDSTKLRPPPTKTSPRDSNTLTLDRIPLQCNAAWASSGTCL